MNRLHQSLVLALVALTLFSGVRLAFFLIYRADFEELDVWDVLVAFCRGLRFDLSVVALLFALPLAMMNLPVRLAGQRRWSRVWGWLAFVVLVPCVLVLVGDLVYYEFVHRHVGNELRLLSSDLTYLVGAARQYAGLLAGVSTVLAATAFLWQRVLALDPAPRRTESGRRDWAAFAALAIAMFLSVRGSVSDKPLALADAFRDQSFAAGNLSLNGMFTVLRSSVRDRAPMPNIGMDEAREVLGLSDDPYPLERRHLGIQPTRRNVVVLLLESWDVRFVDSYLAEPRGLTPNFDRLAAGGLLFENFYAASQRSVGAVQAVLVGVPSVPGIPELGFGLELTSVTRIGSIAAGHGYDTLFVQAPRRRSYYMDSVAPALGFAAYYGQEDLPEHVGGEGFPPQYGWDDDMLQFALDRIDAFDRPFLAALVTGTMHSPYTDPGAEVRVVPHTTHGENGYINTLHYSDWALGRFFDRARTSEWFSSTLFLVSSDHVWKGSAGDDLRAEFRIPAFLLGPGIDPGRESGVRSQLDCLPWILEALGFDDPFAALSSGLMTEDTSSALVNKGGLMGILSSRGSVLHTLEQRVSAQVLAGNVEPDHYAALELELLAACRVARELVTANRWAR